MKLTKPILILFAAAVSGGSSPAALAETYKIDPAHSFIEFTISHLGFSLLKGRFNTIEGELSYDPARPEASRIAVAVDTASVDTHHAERDKHLRSDEFLDVRKFPEARFESTRFEEHSGTATLEGNLTLHGVTRPITVEVEHVGAGDDPWGGYRRGFVGRTTIKRSDFGITYDLGPRAEQMELAFFLEGVREKN